MKYQLVFAYDTGRYVKGDVFSSHKSLELAVKASRRSGYDSFLAVRGVAGHAQAARS